MSESKTICRLLLVDGVLRVEGPSGIVSGPISTEDDLAAYVGDALNLSGIELSATSSAASSPDL